MKGRSVKCARVCALLAACAFTFNGCMSNLTERSLSESPPAQIVVPYEAPQGDSIQQRTLSAVLYFLNYDGTQLLSEVQQLSISGGKSTQEAVLEALFAGPKSSALRPITEEEISLSQIGIPVEVSSGVATVNLSAQARLLSPQELYTVRLAIANTLIELSAIDYVNVLVEGREEGHDLAALMPMGTLSRLSTTDLSAQWAQLETQRAAESAQSITRQATLYFPVRSGSYVASEVRTIVLNSANLQDYVLTLLDELGRGAMTLSDARSVPAPNEYLSSLPEIALMDGTADKVVKLSFTPELTQALSDKGLTPSLYWAMLVNTITTFVPGIDGVLVQVGDTLVESISAQETVDTRVATFVNGVMRRSDFAEYIASYCDVYFPSLSSDKLIRVRRAIRQRQSMLPRTVVRELLKGPDEDEGLIMGQVFPDDISDADFIGFSVQEDAMLINVSRHFQEACAALSRQEEVNLVYAIVNAMTEIAPVSRVYFFVAGEQVSTLSGTLEMKGAFLRNPGIVDKYD